MQSKFIMSWYELIGRDGLIGVCSVARLCCETESVE